MNEIYFNLFLPSGPEPADGWPVALSQHGGGGNKQADLLLSDVATMAQHGIATILINGAGRGSGPLGTLTVTPNAGSPVTFLAGGRSIDQDGDGIIGQRKGENAAAPNTIIGNRDAYRQTTADWMQLVRAIQVGMDVDGDGAPDLDPSHISYFAPSWGGNMGALSWLWNRDVRTGVLINLGAGGEVSFQRLSPVSRPEIGAQLQARTPSLINSPGLTSIGGVPVAGPYFNENIPLRNQAPVINSVDGAMAIQEFIEHSEWVAQSANPAAYAVRTCADSVAGRARQIRDHRNVQGGPEHPQSVDDGRHPSRGPGRPDHLLPQRPGLRRGQPGAEEPAHVGGPDRECCAAGTGHRLRHAGPDRDLLRHERRSGHSPRAARFFETPIAGVSRRASTSSPGRCREHC